MKIWSWCWCSVHTGLGFNVQQLITIRLFLNFAKSELCFWVCGRQREVTEESWEVNMNHAAAERKSITRQKKKHQAFITKRDFYEFTEHLVELLYPIKPHFMQRSNAQAHIKTTPGPVSASAKSTWAKAARSQINEAFTDSCSAGEKRTRLPFIILIKGKLNVTNNYILSVTDQLRLVWLLHKLLWWN